VVALKRLPAIVVMRSEIAIPISSHDSPSPTAEGWGEGFK